jgi:hypothetical protein
MNFSAQYVRRDACSQLQKIFAESTPKVAAADRFDRKTSESVASDSG